MTLVDRLRAAAPGTMLSMQVNDLAALREAADEIERLLAACLAVDDLWSTDALSFPDEMAIPSPVGLAWAKVKEALNAYQQQPN